MPRTRERRPARGNRTAQEISSADGIETSLATVDPRCVTCGRILSAPASIAAGMGRACRRKSLAVEAIVSLNRARARRELRALADRLARGGDPQAASVVSAAAEGVAL